MSINIHFNTGRNPHLTAGGHQENPSAKASLDVWEDLDSATSVEKTQSSVSLVSKEMFQLSNKRPLPLLAEYSEAKSIRLESSGSSEDSAKEEEEPNWTDAQIDRILVEIERRKLAPWDPVGLDELTQKVGGHTRQECVAMYHHIASNEKVFRSLKSMLDLTTQSYALVHSDPALDHYLATGELYPDTVSGSAEGETGLFNE